MSTQIDPTVINLVNIATDVATVLSRYYVDLAKQQVKLMKLDQAIIDREFALTPVTGWPGSNESARKSARDLELKTDKLLYEWRLERFQLIINITLLEGNIKARRVQIDSLNTTLQAVNAQANAGLANFIFGAQVPAGAPQ